jgi:cyanophycinase-like exopeptidase
VQGTITLYALSDDGVTVTVTDTTINDPSMQPLSTVLDNVGVGQAMPDLTQSLKKCSGTLQDGHSYRIVIRYRNTLYTGDGDIDGILMIGIGGKATANETPYFTANPPTRLQVGTMGIFDLRQIFPCSPANTVETKTQDTVLKFSLTAPAVLGTDVSIQMEIQDAMGQWVGAASPNTFVKNTYPTSGYTARLKVTPLQAGDYVIVVTATDSVGAVKVEEYELNAVGDNAIVATPDDYNFNPAGDLVVDQAKGLLRNDYIRPVGTQVTVTIVNQPNDGDISGLMNDGSFTYTKKADSNYWTQANGLTPNDSKKDLLQDSFTYKIESGGMSSTATVTIRASIASNCQNVGSVTTQAGIMLVGSGSVPIGAVDWLRSHGGGGKLVILSASGSAFGGLYSQEASSGKWKCVVGLVINSTAMANDPAVTAALSSATAVFIEGGDQTQYLTTWSGTPVQTLLQGKVGSIPIGGGSAGMHLLGGTIYTPPMSGDGITSAEAIANPNSPLMAFQPRFLAIPDLASIVLDTHFRERDRMARSLAFTLKSGTSKCIMADEGTALLIDNGVGTVAGDGAVFFANNVVGTVTAKLKVDSSSIQRLEAGNGTFNLGNWGTAPVTYSVQIDNTGDVIPTFPYGPYYIFP